SNEIYDVERLGIACAGRTAANIGYSVCGFVQYQNRNPGTHARVFGLAYANAFDISYEIARTRPYHGDPSYRLLKAQKREHPCIYFVEYLSRLSYSRRRRPFSLRRLRVIT